jgi:hypothetical protein
MLETLKDFLDSLWTYIRFGRRQSATVHVHPADFELINSIRNDALRAGDSSFSIRIRDDGNLIGVNDDGSRDEYGPPEPGHMLVVVEYTRGVVVTLMRHKPHENLPA